MTVQIETETVADTMQAGRRLAAFLRPGDVVALCGRLGAGKTAFAGGLAEGLGIEEPVISPSFVLVRSYHSGFIPLVHVDVYRLGSVGEFADLDALEEARDGVLIVEWGDAVSSVLPEDHLRVEIMIRDEDHRSIRFVPSGEWSDRPLEELSL